MRQLFSSFFSASLVLIFGASCSSFEKAPQGERAIARIESALTDVSYALDTNPDLPNPERGVSYWAGNNGSDPHTLKNHFLWLGASCATQLSWQGRSNANTSQVLKDWANTAVGFRDVGQKVIFRPRYDTTSAEGAPNACGKVEGASYAQMQNHVQAIAAMLADPEIKPIVAFVEMGYLGSWGEWNVAGTTCGTDVNNCRPLAPVLLAATAVSDRIHFAEYVINTYRSAGLTRPVALRRPEFYKDAEFNLGVASTKMGFYNDCFMVNSSDAGTFTRLEGDFTNYPALYPNSVLADSATAKSYMQSKAGDGSQGGESCPNGANTETWRTSPASVPTRLDADSFDYLHAGYAVDFRQTMINAGQWDTIKSRLGYRYNVTQVAYPTPVAAGASLTVSVTVDNSGFTRIPYDRTAYIVLYGPTNYIVGNGNPKSGTYTLITPTAQSNQSARSWSKGSSTVFSQTFAAPPVAGTYTVHLYVPDTDCVDNAFCTDTVKAKYALKLATTRGGSNVFNATTGTNDLGVTLAVNAGCTPSCIGKVCGSDGCGGSCGTCSSPATCDGNGQCVSGGSSCAGGGNIVQNCDFSGGTTSWSCGVSGTAAATCSVVSGTHQTVITSPGAFAYSVQPNQGNLALTNGTTYAVSFDARASVANRPITVSVTMNHDAFSSYSGIQNFTLSTSLATQAFNFVMSQASDTNAKIEFDLGANGNNTVFIDNVAIKPTGGGTGTHACSSATDCQTHLTKSGLPAWNSSWGNLLWSSGACNMYDWTGATAYYGTYPDQCSTNQPPGSTCVINNPYSEKEYTWAQCKD